MGQVCVRRGGWVKKREICTASAPDLVGTQSSTFRAPTLTLDAADVCKARDVDLLHHIVVAAAADLRRAGRRGGSGGRRAGEEAIGAAPALPANFACGAMLGRRPRAYGLDAITVRSMRGTGRREPAMRLPPNTPMAAGPPKARHPRATCTSCAAGRSTAHRLQHASPACRS